MTGKLRQLSVPGESAMTALNNIGSQASIATDHERATIMAAAGELSKAGDPDGAMRELQKLLAVGQTAAPVVGEEYEPAIADGVLGPDVLAVSVPTVRRKATHRLGRSLPYPDGTPLGKDRRPLPDDDPLAEAHFVVGRALTPDGWLCAVAIPLPGHDPAFDATQPGRAETAA